MNPANRKSPLDNAKFRENYLSNLRLQASNNQRNLNANLILKQTGSPPPFLPDMRTGTEKLADTEGLKVALRSKLSTLTESNIASQIVGELSPDMIKFALNSWDIIEKDIKSKFSLGVPAPVFISYLNRLNQTLEQNDYVSLGLQQSPYDMLSSMNQILYSMDRHPALMVLGRMIVKGRELFGGEGSSVALQYVGTQASFSSPENMKKIESLNDQDKAEVQRIFTEYIERDLVSTSAVKELTSRLAMALSRNDERFYNQVVNTIISNFELSETTEGAMRRILDIIRTSQPQPERRQVEDIGGGGGERPPDFAEQEIEEEQARAQTEAQFTPVQETLRPTEEGKVKEATSIPTNLVSYDNFSKSKKDGGLGLTRPQKGEYINQFLKANPDITIRADSPDTKGREIVIGADARRELIPLGSGGMTNTQVYHLHELYADLLRQLAEKGITPTAGGRGLMKVGRMKGKGLSHLVEAQYEKPKLYTQFGRYFINKPKLSSSILSLRTPAGGIIKELPPQRMSPALHSVVSTLVGHGLPTYEHISKLNDDDRDKLVEICRVCRVEVPSVPKTTNMDNEEKENYRFEVLKGELFAGNNAPKIVKEFKSLLLKFINRGKVPRREGHEILQNLIELGL